VHPDFAEHLESDEREPLQRLAQALDVKITIQPVAAQASREDYEITVR
jgi:hypothetical protein